jgi:hypothetical protein
MLVLERTDMVALVHTISHRIAKYLEKAGLAQRNTENSYLNLPVDDVDSLLHLQGASVSYRIAIGPQQGQKVFTLRTLPASTESEYGQLANTSGFSLHAGVFANADEPEKLERLCRYISRPAISEQRISMTQHGKVRYELKTPYKILKNRLYHGRAACTQIPLLLYQRLEKTIQ